MKPHAGLSRFIAIFLCVTSCNAEAGTPEATPTKWSVPTAIAQALAHNPDAGAAAERMRATEADIKIAQSAFYPQIDLGGEYSRTNNAMYSFGNILNQGMFSNTIDFNDPGTTDTLQAKATVQYRLYNGGRDRAMLEAADSRTQASEQEGAAIRCQLEFAVVRAFCTIVQAGEVVAARQSALEAISVSRAVAQARFEEGSLLKEEVLNLEVQQSRAQEQLIQAQHSLSLAQRGFLRLLDLPGATVSLDPLATPAQEIPAIPDINGRAELKAITAQVKAMEALVRQARGGYQPTADLFGSYQVEKGTTLDEGSGNSWTGGVRLNYPLFNGGRTNAEVEGAEARLREARERQRNLELAFDLEKEQATLALHQEDERLKLTGKMVESAKESARLARLRFKEGVLLSSELIDTENRLTDALLSHTLATAARRIAIADLRRCAGLHQF